MPTVSSLLRLASDTFQVALDCYDVPRIQVDGRDFPYRASKSSTTRDSVGTA